MKPLEFQSDGPSETDVLTGCLLKKDLAFCLEKLAAGYQQQKKVFSVLFVGVDNFKKLNRKYGRLEGDEVLRYFAITLHVFFKNVPSLLFRYGEDEFALVFPDKSDTEVMELARTWINKLKASELRLKSANKMVTISFTGGVAMYPADGNTIKALIHNADKAMYFAKRQKRGSVVLSSGIRKNRVIKTVVQLCSLIFALLFLSFVSGTSNLPSCCAFQAGQLLILAKEKFSAIVSQCPLQSGKGPSAQGWMQKPDTSVVSKPRPLDTVYFTSGEPLRGEVVYEDEVLVRIKCQPESGGSGYMIITKLKSEIVRIERADAQSPR